MKIKLDENMPTRLVAILSQLGHQADTVPQEGLSGSADEQVWHEAQNQGRFLITQDLHFSDIRRFKPGTHHGLLLVRLRAPGRQALVAHTQALFETEDVTAWQGCVVVLSEHKVRILRPQ